MPRITRILTKNLSKNPVENRTRCSTRRFPNLCVSSAVHWANCKEHISRVPFEASAIAVNPHEYPLEKTTLCLRAFAANFGHKGTKTQGLFRKPSKTCFTEQRIVFAVQNYPDSQGFNPWQSVKSVANPH